MKKLYVTHKPSELVGAWVQLQCVGASAWMAYSWDSIFLRILFAQVGALAAVMVYVFLFTMSGSRERAKATASEVGHE